VITIDLICEVCGTSNPPGTEFCTNCNSYLAWDRSVLAKPSGQPSKPAPPSNQSTQPTQKEWATQPPPAGGPTGGYPNVGPADQAYASQGYVDPGYGGQGYYDGGYNQGGYQGGYYPGGAAGGAPTLEQPAYTDMSCPNCGTINSGTRRFCTHCGYAFFYNEADPYAGYYASSANQAAQDRVARKAYRRSLPPLYRWRRVIIGVLVVALLVAVAVLLHQDPVGIVKGAWYGMRQEYVWVKPVQAAVVPPEATAPKSDPAALVDESENEWTMNWAPTGESSCGPAPGTGFIVLNLATPTRIRLIQIAPGLADSNPQRKLQPLPKVIGIAFDNGACHAETLTATPGQQEIKIDSGKPVTRVMIGIGSAYPAPNGQPLMSITEVILKAYPS
jgi:hypothetical protein